MDITCINEEILGTKLDQETAVFFGWREKAERILHGEGEKRLEVITTSASQTLQCPK